MILPPDLGEPAPDCAPDWAPAPQTQTTPLARACGSCLLSQCPAREPFITSPRADVWEPPQLAEREADVWVHPPPTAGGAGGGRPGLAAPALPGLCC